MMAFRINLIRHRPLPLLQRPEVALTLLLCLFAVGLLLAGSIHLALRDMQAARLQQRQASADRALFSRQHRQADIACYRTTLRQQLEAATENLALAEKMLARKVPMAAILYTLTAALPRTVRLQSLHIVNQDLELELAMPADMEGRHIDPLPSLIRWQNTSEMQNLIASVREENSQLVEIGEHATDLARYTITLKGGE